MSVKTGILSFAASNVVFFMLLPVFLQLVSYLHPLVLGVVWICLFTFMAITVLMIRKEQLRMSSSMLWTLAAGYSIGLLVLLFIRPGESMYRPPNFALFQTISFYLSHQVSPLIAVYNLAANIGLFIPYGFALKTMSLHQGQRLLLAFCVILLIECLQFFTQRGSFDIDDVVLNLLGVQIGMWLFPLLQQTIKISR